MFKKFSLLLLLSSTLALPLTSVSAVEGSPLAEGEGAFINFSQPTVEKKVSTHFLKDGEGYDGKANLEIAPTDSAVSNIDRSIDFEFTTLLPEDIEGYKTYMLTDTFNDVFDITTLNKENVKLTVDGKAVEGEISINDRTLTISFNEAQLKALGAINPDRKTSLNLKVKFSIDVDPSKAKSDLKTQNKVTLDWDNNLGGTGQKDYTVEVELKEGALEVLKKDGKSKNFLPGAEFKLYYQLDDTKLAEGATGETIDGIKNLVPATNSEKEDVSVVKVDAEGKAVVPRLPFGRYYIQETKAPNGYRLVRSLTQIDIKDTENELSYGDAKYVDGVSLTVDNFKSSDNFPATGTWGVLGFVTAAGALIVGAVAIDRKKEVKE